MTQWNVLSLRVHTMVVNVQLTKSKAHSLFITYLHVDGDFEVFAFNPVDPRKLYTKENLEEMRVEDPTNPMLQDVEFVFKKCPFCNDQNFSSEHEYQLHLRKHIPQCPHCLLRLPSWSKYPDHFAYCTRSVRRLKINNPSNGGSRRSDFYLTSDYRQDLVNF